MTTTTQQDALIDAAEERAKLYDGDDRECIKADVMNAFFAGAEYADRASRQVAEKVTCGFCKGTGDGEIGLHGCTDCNGKGYFWEPIEDDVASRQVANQDRMIGMATWISQNPSRLPDHACRNCVGDAEMVIPGFRCGYHDALAFLNSPDARQVANKAEVEPMVAAYVNFETLDCVIGFGGDRIPEGYCPVATLPLATPPATTGASTVLTDERSQITDTESARRFVDAWHRKHFPTDRTFTRYIMNDPERQNPLAGDFAWQLAKALESVAAQAGQVAVPEGWKLVPVEPTLDMVTHGFESAPDEFFSPVEDWDTYAAMTGCQKSAHRAKLCYAAMLAAAPSPAKESK